MRKHADAFRRDQRAVCCASRSSRRPLALRRRPFHFANPRARHERAFAGRHTRGGFRLRLGGGALRSGYVALGTTLRPALHFPRSPTTDRSGLLLEFEISATVLRDFVLIHTMAVVDMQLRSNSVIAMKPLSMVWRRRSRQGRAPRRPRLHLDSTAVAGDFCL